MSGTGTDGQNGSAYGTKTGPSLFGSGGPTPNPNSNATQPQPSTTPNASGAIGSAAARRPETAQSPPSLLGAASTGITLFGPSPVSSTVAPAAASATRGSLFGAGAPATGSGLFGSVSAAAGHTSTCSGLLGSIAPPPMLIALTMNSGLFDTTSTAGNSLFDSSQSFSRSFNNQRSHRRLLQQQLCCNSIGNNYHSTNTHKGFIWRWQLLQMGRIQE